MFVELPRSLKVIIVLIYGWRNRIRRYGRTYQSWKHFISYSENWTEDQRVEWTRQTLLALIQNARRGSTYYKNTIPVPQDSFHIFSLSDLRASLPILSKSTLKTKTVEITNDNFPSHTKTSTSGSTGSPTTVEHDWPSIQKRYAFLEDHLSRLGVSNFVASVRLSGRILFDPAMNHKKPWLYNYAENQLFLSTYHLDVNHACAIAEKIDRFQPLVLDGYPSAINQLLRLCTEQKVSLWSLKVILVTAETLTPEVRREMESLSGAIVVDYYAASEGVPLIQQCEFGVYHVRWQSGLFEVYEEDSVKTEGSGELICTSFVQDRTPLIRYKTGDVVTDLRCAPEEACACGLRTPTVASVDGRLEDMVITSDGRRLGMFSYRTIKTITDIRQAQIIQESLSEFCVKYSIETGADRQEVEKKIKENFEKVLGYEVALTTELVEDIPLGPNGKTRLVISHVEKS